jgi:hypothetical protein
MNMGRTYGYTRVSTDGQTLDAQVAAPKAAGAKRVFSEKQSGAKTDRAGLARALPWGMSHLFVRSPTGEPLLGQAPTGLAGQAKERAHHCPIASAGGSRMMPHMLGSRLITNPGCGNHEHRRTRL